MDPLCFQVHANLRMHLLPLVDKIVSDLTTATATATREREREQGRIRKAMLAVLHRIVNGHLTDAEDEDRMAAAAVPAVAAAESAGAGDKAEEGKVTPPGPRPGWTTAQRDLYRQHVADARAALLGATLPHKRLFTMRCVETQKELYTTKANPLHLHSDSHPGS